MNRTAISSIVLLALALMLWCPQSQAQPSQPAEPDPAAVKDGLARFRKGVELFHEGNHQAALAEFRRAYQIAPSFAILYNIGQVQFELRDYAGALRAFEQYLADGGERVKPDRRSEVEAEIEKLQGRVARIEVVVDVAGAEIAVDDAVVGESPLADPLLVSAGQVRLRVSKVGHEPAVRRIEVAGGDAKRVELELLKKESTAAVSPPTAKPKPAPVPPPETAPHSPDRTGLWISVAVTGALAVGTVVVGVLALSAKSDFEAELDAYPTTADDIEDARTDLQILAGVTDALGAATIVAAGITVVVGLTGDDESADGAAASAATIRVVGRPGGLALEGRF